MCCGLAELPPPHVEALFDRTGPQLSRTEILDPTFAGERRSAMSKTPYPSTTIALVLVACLACGSAVAQQFSAWSAPVNLGRSINTEFSEFQSAISADGLTLFFASDRP
jgi:hypothetical protein